MTKIISYFNIINKIFLLQYHKDSTPNYPNQIYRWWKKYYEFFIWGKFFLEILGEATASFASFASLWLRACFLLTIHWESLDSDSDSAFYVT